MDEFLNQIFQDFFYYLFRIVGARFRWLFLRRKYSFKEILEQNWNGRIGFMIISIMTLCILYFIKK